MILFFFNFLYLHRCTCAQVACVLVYLELIVLFLSSVMYDVLGVVHLALFPHR